MQLMCFRGTDRLVAVLLLCMIGCTAEQAAPAVDRHDAAVEKDSVLALLERVRQEPISMAFERLAAYEYVLHRRTAQLDNRGETMALVDEVVRVDTGGRRHQIRSDTTGEFAFGVLDRFASRGGRQEMINPARYIVPEDPPYLSARGRISYLFSFQPDTLVQGRNVRVVRVEAGPEAEGDHRIRSARLHIDAVAEELIGIEVVLEERALLFRERSILSMEIQPAPNGMWVPHRVRLQTRINPPLLPARRFDTQLVYRDYR